MPEANFVQRQREILRIFRNATARRRAERQAADAKLEQVQQKANSQLAAVHKAQDEAQVALWEVGLQHLLEKRSPTPPIAPPGADPAQALAHSTSVVSEAATAIPDAVDALQQWREAAALRRRLLMTGCTVLTLIICTAAGRLGYQAWQAGQRAIQARTQAATAQARVAATATAIAVPLATAVVRGATAIAAPLATAVVDMPLAMRQLVERFGLVFVYVPPGEFTMGSPEGEGDSDEHPQHTVYLDGFWIGLTEVSNTQYRPFVEAGGYQERELWTEAGWEWREANNVTQPDCWNDDRWNQPAYPVVCVSWYEAAAYTRWLARETGLAVRLPTEAEWEKASRGTDGRRYPWGDDWDETKANTAEGGADRTTPVGAYPAGASPYGALDMAGNVWEWTSSLYEDYPYRRDDGREEMEGSGHRVVRGGSWRRNQRVTRSAPRYGYNPVFRNRSLGLRVVVAAPR